MFSAKRGIYSDLVTFGQTRNSGVMSILAFEQAAPSPVFEWVAAYTGKAQRALTNDPARPLQTLSLNRIKLAPLHQNLFVETSPAPIKYAMSLLGKCENSVRLPMVPASPKAEAAVREAMVHAGLIN